MRTPAFWYDKNARALKSALWPFSLVFSLCTRARFFLTRPRRASVPVICVGNAVAGGAGKTPVVITLAALLKAMGFKPVILTRGYGGDEAVLLGKHAKTVVSADRVQGAVQAVALGADVILMDDGFQNPSLHKDLSFLVVDGFSGFGNSAVIPAGPLREPVATALDRAQAVIFIGEGQPPATEKPVFRARLVPQASAAVVQGKKIFAFAGIGRPEKFRKTLQDLGADVVRFTEFPDHHAYDRAEIEKLILDANGLILATTEKDAVKIPPDLKDKITVVPVSLEFSDVPGFESFIRKGIKL